MTNNLGFALTGAWQVLVAGLLLGAGLPVLFALGIRSLAWGAGEASVDATGVTPGRRRPVGTALGYLLFAVVVAGVLLGLTFIVATGFGNKLSFEHIYPTIVPK
ncbi:hypothetical protein BJY16_008068 [Actinoplanes octamycinicus]|uniref:Transmembrane protein n=1 Tax=Actinoplanes octamycinicus TaxID=135948 RepID=A0A7W7H657_9ACTN|nr:hypothetical protein [Actinoplanes octamycinicus]MBB4744609.1 hypothetical protein [Actinoplanes octamycinicus]GIE55191.1 hypothetical protein Aoc01nite_05930 [Actinoplanes octamycinicus]